METHIQALKDRIDAEFAQSRAKLEKVREEKVEEYQGRKDRIVLFEQACDRLRGVWKPRLEALQKTFGDQVQVTPTYAAGRRQGSFAFTSPLARITLNFTAATDTDVRKLILEYSLEIVPVLMTYPDKVRLEQPFDKIDENAIGTWIDDRIIDFVKVYLSVHENEFYLKAHMVEDPVAHVRFPEFAAATTLERGGKTLYFIANQTRQEFEAKERRSAG